MSMSQSYSNGVGAARGARERFAMRKVTFRPSGVHTTSPESAAAQSALNEAYVITS
jgi:hypothetical protein